MKNLLIKAVSAGLCAVIAANSFCISALALERRSVQNQTSVSVTANAGKSYKIKSKAKTASGTSAKSNISYTVKDGVLTLSGSGAMAECDYDSYAWSGEKSKVTSIVVSSGITSLAKFAFAEFSKVTSVQLPSSVVEIGEAAFYQCYALTSLNGGSVKTLGSGAFYACSKLTSFDTSSLETVGDYSFQNTGITSFAVTSKLKTLSGLAFFGSSISSFTGSSTGAYQVKNGLLCCDNGKTVFAYPPAKAASAVTIQNGITKIGEAAFANSAITSLTIPETVTEIGSSAFQGVKQLKSVKIPDSVKTVGDFTFYKCEDLTEVTFGKGLKESSYQMFRYCSSLKTINFGGLEILGAHTFATCTSLSEVSLPATVKELGVGAFGECSNLRSFTSEAIDCVPYQAFLGCKKLESVKLNEGVTDIYRESFPYCDSLESITLPKSVKFVHTGAFPDSTEIICLNTKLSPYGENGYALIDKVNIDVDYNYDFAFKVLELVNKERASEGLGKLVMNSSLLDTAMFRAGETTLLFSHTRPDSSICFTADSAMFAENIAAGQATPKDVMNSWMNSEGHKANILNKDAKTIGIGCAYHNGCYYWVQCFGTGSDTSSCKKPANESALQTVSFMTEEFSEAPTDSGVIFGSSDTYVIKPYISIQSKKLTVGDKKTLKVYIDNPGGFTTARIKNNSFKWSSSSDCVSVKNGVITAISEGTAVITASLNNTKIKIKITVKAPQKAVTKPAKGIIKKLKKGKKSIKVYFKKIDGATGYQVQYSAKKNMKGKKTVNVTGKLSVKLKGLKKNKKYFVRVRAYKTVNSTKIYGKWSVKKAVKTK